DYLRERVIPELVAHAHANNNELRIWSAGCSTGEEPYSIAMLVAEALGTEALQINVRLFATDVDAEAIAFARRGRYPASVVATVPDHLRARYFTPVENGYEVTKTIRNMVIFGEHDLAQRAPFPHIDLVFCRNVLIYFTPELQLHALRLFGFSLRNGGFLVLGNAESAGALGAYFAQADPRFKVYRRQGEHILVPPLPIGGRRGDVGAESAPTQAALTLAGPPQLHLVPTVEVAPQQTASVAKLNRLTRDVGQRVYSTRERFADRILRLPLGVVVVDRNYDVLSINSAAYALMDVHRPAMGRDILHLAERVPTKSLRAAIDAAFQTTELATPSTGAATVKVQLEPQGAPSTPGEQAREPILQIACYPERGTSVSPDGGTTPIVEAVVLLISEAPRGSEAAVEGEAALGVGGGAATVGALPAVPRDEALARSQQELAAEHDKTRELEIANQELREDNDRLRRANEDLFVAQEEVQASSEEIKALNEEMQATNEELETLNEELEATVEELHTTNDDLVARAQQLQQVAQEREEQRQATEQERAQLAAMLSSMRDAVLAVDATGKPVLSNAAYQRIFGDVEAQVGQGQIVIEDELGRALPPEAFPWRRAGEQEPFMVAFTLRALDGTRRWFEAAGQPILVERQRRGGVVTIHDLTDYGMRSLYERFLAQVSHELATPLTTLVVTLQMLERQLPAKAGTESDERIHTLVANAQRHARQLGTLVGDLGDLERVQHDKLKLTLQLLDLAEIVRRVVEDIQLSRPAGQPSPPIIVRIEPREGQFWVSGDAVRLEQILRNVLTNALRYAPESNRIDVRLRRVHERNVPEVAEIEVQDYGSGIPTAELTSVFKPFFQGARETVLHRGGLGLGLYIVDQLVKAHDGQIEARSPEGRGTAITIRFPLTGAPAEAASDKPTPVRKPTPTPKSDENQPDGNRHG
ncbi:MAG TPA: CheR family methyltransferase, partial [Ktedonobacterales bacterium]|nr:CheR family methyltransferase [Ktedonobacterales bacterium]